MKNLTYKISIVVLTLMFFISCTSYFEEMNTNPNQFTNPSTDLILPTVIISAAYNYNSDVLRSFGGVYGQYYVNLTNLSPDRFIEYRGDFRNYFLIRHAQIIYEKAKAQNYPNRMGVALVLKAFMFAEITDEMGDIPYSEAVDYEKSLYPSYDKQEDIYLGENGLLASLDEANTLLSNIKDGLDPTSDILYGGNVMKWRKFANSLRLRLLIRISNKTVVNDKISEIVNNPAKYPIFEANTDNAELPYVDKNSSYASPFGVSTNLGNTYYNERAACATVIDALKEINDPRLKAYFDPIPSNLNVYVGIPSGIGSPSNFNGGEANFSRLSSKFKQDANKFLPAKMLQYSEVMFLMAEAAQRHLISGDGKDYYLKGIQASFDYWQVQPPVDYFIQEKVAYKGSLEQIITQKWMANFCVGAEAWFDYRRTGFPQFYIGAATMLNGQFVKRLMYPVDEEANNLSSLKKAIQQQGENNNLTKMWYLN